MTLAERVKSLLEAQNISASAASVKARLGRRYVQDILDEAKLSLTHTKAEQLASALETTVEYLLYGIEPLTPEDSEELAEVADIWNNIKTSPEGKAWIEMGRAINSSDD